MKIFDAHTHVFPEVIADRAISHLRDLSHGIPAYTDGTAQDLERKALKAGYTAWMNCPVVTTARQMTTINDYAARLNGFPHLSMGGLFPNAPMDEVIATADRIRSLGLCGVKFHPEYQSFNPLDERLTPLWEHLAALHLPVLFHAGNDIGFAGQKQHSTPGDFAQLARRFPALTIICAHLGGWKNWNDVENNLAGAPVYLDTSFAKPWMADQRQYERIIRKHGPEHILFGTDSPWNDLSDGIRELEETTLSTREKELIFYENAARLFNL